VIAENSELKSYHRPDIQGLRGVAVLLVVIYHTGIAFPGGFIGVDMFFVISGFVITQVLLREFEETGTIRLRGFYARRARRLIPALSLMIIFTLLVSLVVMSPFGEQQQIIKTAVASVFFAGNIHLFAMNTYDALKNNPLRHLWSLGVEEQFYWVYPLFFVGVLRASKNIFYIKRLIAVLTAFAIISFGIGVFLTYGFEFGYKRGSFMQTHLGFLSKIGFQPGGGWPTKFAFFGAQARFWEILVGAVLAVCVNNLVIQSKFGSRVLVTVGVGAISLATLMFSPVSKFPGVIALLPVVGTALIILFGRQLKVCSDLLSSKQLVYIGDISYSLYLWHWPFIVFARAIWPATQGVAAIAAALSFIPAGLSYRFVETRLRSKPTGERKYGKTILAFVVIVPLVFSFGLQKAANTGLGIPLPTSKYLDFATMNNCGDGNSDWVKSCNFTKDGSRFSAVLVGDSNARSASDGVVKAVNALGGRLYISVESGCPFIDQSFGSDDYFEPDCRELNRGRFSAISLLKPDIVVIVGSQTTYMPNWDKDSILLSLERSLKIMADSDISAVVQGQIPDCNFTLTFISMITENLHRCAISLQDQTIRNELLVESRNLTTKSESHRFVDPTDLICPNEICMSYRDGEWVYSDGNHLSKFGSQLLEPLFQNAIKEILAIKNL
jgi:peptidoglycan/LPS O-acetylase OafA/YrhL